MNNFAKAQELKVEEAVREWLDIHCDNLSQSTQYTYKMYMQGHILPVIGDIPVSYVKQKDVQKVINKMAKRKRSLKTQKNAIGVMSSFFRYALVNGYIEKQPVRDIVKHRTAPHQYYIYSEQELQQLLENCRSCKDRLAIRFAARAGLRLSETFGLRWKDITFLSESASVAYIYHTAVAIGNHCIDIKDTPKTAAGCRKVELCEELTKELLAIKSAEKPSQTSYIFCDADNTEKPEMSQNFKRRLNRTIERAGLPHTRFHDLRHFAATEFMDGGASDKLIAAYLGHSDTNITRMYQHIRSNIVPYPLKQGK